MARAVPISDLLILTAVALVVRILAAVPVSFAPYTDSAYYTLVAEQLTAGQGMTVPVIWSFLEVGGQVPDPAGLPVPSNAHWMPLASIIAAGAMVTLGDGWRSGQVPMILMATAIVPLTYLIAWDFWRSRWVAVIASILAVFAGPLLIYYPTIENFGAFGMLGALAIYSACRAVTSSHPGRWLVVSGALVGGATLARIDGILLAVAPATAWLIGRGWTPWQASSHRSGWLAGLASGGAFGVVVAPWLFRNVATFGSALPGASGHALWITSYNEQFSVGHEVSLATYLDWGLANIVASKVGAWIELLGRTGVILGGVFIVAFIPGLWMIRRRQDLAPFLVYFLTMFGLMGGLFTFHAPAGAYYHSAPAWLPFAYPLAIASIPAVGKAAGPLWPFLRRPRTHRFFAVAGTVGAVVLSVLSSSVIFSEWDRSHRLDSEAAQFFLDHGATHDVVMSADPPSLALLSKNPGVSYSFDPFPVLERIVDAYDVRWVVVELPEGGGPDPLNLWRGSDATDALGNRATWLEHGPAFEIPGALRIFQTTGS